MQLAFSQLSTHLQKGLRSLYVLHGDEPLMQQEAADAIRSAARAQGYTERSVHTVSGAHFDWSEVLAAGGSLSLFADKQIVEVRIPSGKPARRSSCRSARTRKWPGTWDRGSSHRLWLGSQRCIYLPFQMDGRSRHRSC